MYYFCAPVQKLPQLAIVQVEILGRILRLPVHACFEMQMRCRGTSCLAYECYYLASLHALPLLHQILRVVGVIGLKPVGGAGCAAIGAALQASCDSIVIANTVTSVTATKLDDAPCCIGIADEGSQNLPTPRAPVESP